MAGIPTHASQVHNVIGGISREVMNIFDQIGVFNDWVTSLDQADIDALELLPEDIALIGGVIADLMQLRSIYEGGASLANAKDFRLLVRQLAGLRAEV